MFAIGPAAWAASRHASETLVGVTKEAKLGSRLVIHGKLDALR